MRLYVVATHSQNDLQLCKKWRLRLLTYHALLDGAYV